MAVTYITKIGDGLYVYTFAKKTELDIWVLDAHWTCYKFLSKTDNRRPNMSKTFAKLSHADYCDLGIEIIWKK